MVKGAQAWGKGVEKVLDANMDNSILVPSGVQYRPTPPWSSLPPSDLGVSNCGQRLWSPSCDEQRKSELGSETYPTCQHPNSGNQGDRVERCPRNKPVLGQGFTHWGPSGQEVQWGKGPGRLGDTVQIAKSLPDLLHVGVSASQDTQEERSGERGS